MVEYLQDTLQIYHLEANQIAIEITETAIMSRGKLSESILKKFHKMGFIITIDDFGTGYSSLSHIKRLPIDALKIDRSFVSNIPNNKNDSAIVESVILLSEKLGLNVIAEGVETQIQLDFLLENNCLEGQGYFLSKPINAAEMTKLLAQRKTAR